MTDTQPRVWWPCSVVPDIAEYRHEFFAVEVQWIEGGEREVLPIAYCNHVPVGYGPAGDLDGPEDHITGWRFVSFEGGFEITTYRPVWPEVSLVQYAPFPTPPTGGTR